LAIRTSPLARNMTFGPSQHDGLDPPMNVMRSVVSVHPSDCLFSLYPLAVEALVMQHLQYGMNSVSKFAVARRLLLLRATAADR